MAFSEGCLMVKSIILCHIRVAAGTTPTLTARDNSQIFSASKVWRSLLEHSSTLKFGPLFSWTAFKLHKGLFASWLVVVHIHQTPSTRQLLGEKWQRDTFLVMSCYPSCTRACVLHPWYVAGAQRFIFSSCATASAPGSCTNPASPPSAGIYPLLSWAQQVRFLTHPFTRSLVSLGFSLGQYGLSLLPEFTHPCACSLLLMPCSGQTQPLVQIRMLQGSACPTHSSPNSPFWLCGFREQSHQGENPKGGCAEPHASILLKCHNVCNTWSDLCWCGTSQFNSVAPVQNLFPDFVATLIVEGQNASLLFYLGPAFMDDYSYPAGAWRSISLKISMCPQVIGVMCSKGKCLIRGRFLQESRKQPFPAVNQLFLKMENVFSHHLLTRGGHPDRGCHCSGWQRWLTWNLEPRLPLQNCCSALHLLSCLTQAI